MAADEYAARRPVRGRDGEEGIVDFGGAAEHGGEEAREAEAPDEAYEAAEGVEDEP